MINPEDDRRRNTYFTHWWRTRDRARPLGTPHCVGGEHRRGEVAQQTRKQNSDSATWQVAVLLELLAFVISLGGLSFRSESVGDISVPGDDVITTVIRTADMTKALPNVRTAVWAIKTWI